MPKVQLTDPFDRTVSVGDSWGTGVLGTYADDPGRDYSVDGDHGLVTDAYGAFQALPIPGAILAEPSWTAHLRFKWPASFGTASIFSASVSFYDEPNFDSEVGVEVRYFPDTPATTVTVYWYSPTGSDDDILAVADPTAGAYAHLVIGWDHESNQVRTRYWEEPAGDPGVWQQVLGGIDFASLAAVPSMYVYGSGNDNGGLDPAPITLEVDSLALAGGIITTELDTPFDYSVEAELDTPFDVSVGAELWTPFTMYVKPPETELSTPFDMSGRVQSTLSTPFTMLGPMETTLSTPFAMKAAAIVPRWGNLPVQAPVINVTLTAPASPGDTVIFVTTTAGITSGMLVRLNAPETVPVAEVLDGTSLRLASPLAYSHLNGSAVSSLEGFQPLLYVCDKGGSLIGTIRDFSIVDAPTQAIMSIRAPGAALGSMTFHVPRTLEDGQTPNPEADLIFDDRIVVLGVEIGGSPWAGAMVPQLSAGGVIEVTCIDLFGQFVRGPSLEISTVVNDGTPAWAIVAGMIESSNARKGIDGELLWDVEATGSKAFRGNRHEYHGDVIGGLEDVVQNAGIEIMWRADMIGSQLVATLVISDRFEQASSLVLFDGPGGNIMANPRIHRDPSPIVHELTLIGQPTDLSDCLPEYAGWAIQNSTPRVTVSVDPGPRRRRAKLEVSVPWGYSQATIDALCAATLEPLWDLFYGFLRAIHDMEGRPFHDGYLFEGPSDYFDSAASGARALSRIAYRTRLQLVETFPDTPASAVMISDSNMVVNRNQWIIVNYNRLTGQQSLAYWPFTEVSGASITAWNVPEGLPYTSYKVSGTRIYERVIHPDSGPGGTGAFCESYNTRLYDATSVPPRYRDMRRIISGSFTGQFIDPAAANFILTDFGPGAGIDLDGLSQLIGKVYDFEALNIDKWDPFRDGVGEYLNVPTVFNGALTTRGRWHIRPYNAGSDARTSLVYGISPTETEIVVESFQGWPTPESADFPFRAQFGDGLRREVVEVVAMIGLQWTVVRGLDGTTAILHEPGEPVYRVGATSAPGLTPVDIPWPEGQAYAEELLAILSRPSITLDIDIANIDDEWARAGFGDVVSIDISTEDAGDGYTGSARIIGRSPDPFGSSGPPGALKVILEPVG